MLGWYEETNSFWSWFFWGISVIIVTLICIWQRKRIKEIWKNEDEKDRDDV